MPEILKELKERYYHLRNKIMVINTFMKDAPEGYMKISRRGANQWIHYHMIKDQKERNKQKGIYLSHKKEKDKEMMKQLAKKSYYKNMLPVLENEAKVLADMIHHYHPQQKYQIYEDMSEERKKLVDNEFLRPEDIVRLWEEQEASPSTKYIENLDMETLNGQRVRSKSEMLIASALDHYSEYLAYKYEEELYVSHSGFSMYPDFTIMKRKNAKIYYWEHCGMMDNQEYVEMFIEKVNRYIMEGIYPGDQLILTFESKDKHLNMMVVKRIIEHYFVED